MESENLKEVTDKYNNGILVVAELNQEEIHPVSYELLNKARAIAKKLNSSVKSVLMAPPGVECQELIYHGADSVYIIENDIFKEPNEIIFKNNLKYLIKKIKPEVVLFGATNFGRSLAPRVAASLEVGLTADCTDLDINEEGKLIQIRPAFSENILAHIKSETFPQMATIRYKEFEKADRDPARTGEIIHENPVFSGEKLVEILKTAGKEQVNITEAEVIVAGGGGLEKPEDFNLLKELADKIGGTIAASRKVVDEGYVSQEYQVGYSGNRVKPKIYFACGISGASQHLAGMKESEIIIAVNTDSSAPIFEVADIGIVGDLYEVIPELIQMIEDKS